MRVEILKKYVFENFPKIYHVEFALKVEQVTFRKKNNLILNVDGFIANAMLDRWIDRNFREERSN